MSVYDLYKPLRNLLRLYPLLDSPASCMRIFNIYNSHPRFHIALTLIPLYTPRTNRSTSLRMATRLASKRDHSHRSSSIPLATAP